MWMSLAHAVAENHVEAHEPCCWGLQKGTQVSFTLIASINDYKLTDKNERLIRILWHYLSPPMLFTQNNSQK